MTAVLCALAAAATLTGETSHPEDSFFAWKSEAKLTLTARGFGPHETRPLAVRVLDHEERETVGRIAAPRWLGCQQNFATCYQPSTSTCRSRRTP